MEWTGLASHPLAALVIALAVIGGLVVAVRSLWARLGEVQAENKRLYELNRELCQAALMAGLARGGGNADLVARAAPAPAAGADPASAAPHRGRGPHQGGPADA